MYSFPISSNFLFWKISNIIYLHFRFSSLSTCCQTVNILPHYLPPTPVSPYLYNVFCILKYGNVSIFRNRLSYSGVLHNFISGPSCSLHEHSPQIIEHSFLRNKNFFLNNHNLLCENVNIDSVMSSSIYSMCQTFTHPQSVFWSWFLKLPIQSEFPYCLWLEVSLVSFKL